MPMSPNSKPIDPASFDDPVARAVAERFVAGDLPVKPKRGPRPVWSGAGTAPKDERGRRARVRDRTQGRERHTRGLG